MTAEVGRYAFADVEVRAAVALPELLPVPAEAVDQPDTVTVQWRAWTAQPVEWFHWWGAPEAPWARFGETASAYVIEFPEVATFRVSRDGTVIEVDAAPAVPPFTVRHVLLNQVLPLALTRMGRVVLHAGAVAVQGRVTAFVGPSGAGKSTLVGACADRGAEVMADDSLVLRRTAVGWLAVPSYPAIRLWDSALDLLGWARRGSGPTAHYTDKQRVSPESGRWRFADRPRPLTQLVLLGGDDEGVRPVGVELYSQIFRLDIRDRVEAVGIFHQVADLARDVAVVRLAQPVEDRSAPVIARAVCEQHLVAGAPVFGA